MPRDLLGDGACFFLFVRLYLLTKAENASIYLFVFALFLYLPFGKEKLQCQETLSGVNILSDNSIPASFKINGNEPEKWLEKDCEIKKPTIKSRHLLSYRLPIKQSKTSSCADFAHDYWSLIIFLHFNRKAVLLQVCEQEGICRKQVLDSAPVPLSF